MCGHWEHKQILEKGRGTGKSCVKPLARKEVSGRYISGKRAAQSQARLRFNFIENRELHQSFLSRREDIIRGRLWEIHLAGTWLGGKR